MIKKFRHAVLTLTASLLATASLKADDSQKQIRNLENRVSSLEQRKSSGGIILPPVYPLVKNGANLGISAEYLYWKAHQDNDAYSVAYGPIGDPNTGPQGSARGETPHYKWNSGFRIDLDYGLPHDGWNTTLDWTHIRNTAHASPNGGKNFLQTDTPLTNTVNQLPTLVFSSQHSKLKLDLLDLDLGRAFFTSKWLTLRPFAGLRAAWIDEKFVSTIKQNNAVLVQLTRKNRTRGIGLRAGLDAEWGLGTGFSIFTDGAIALIYTRYEPTIKCLGDDVGPASIWQNLNDYKKNFYESRLNVDLALGLQWEHFYSQDRYGLRFRAGWEQHTFVNQGMIPIYISGSSQAIDNSTGDLSVQGWTFSGKFDF